MKIRMQALSFGVVLLLLSLASTGFALGGKIESKNPKNQTDLSPLEILPAELLTQVVARLPNPGDADALAVVSQTIYDKIYTDRLRRLAFLRARRKLMPIATTSAGKTYVRRIDLEKTFAGTYFGPIWEAPAEGPFPGLIWFPIEQAHGEVLELDARQSRKICRRRALELGVDLRAPTFEELSQHLPFMKEFPSPLLPGASLRVSGPARNTHWTLNMDPQGPVAFDGYEGHKFYPGSDRPLPARCVFEFKKVHETDFLKIIESITLSLLRAGFNYREATQTRAVFTERVDLEVKYRGLVFGEIWEEPVVNGNLIWFPYERIDGKLGHFTRAQVLQRCEERSRELGLKLRPVIEQEAFRFREYFGARPGSAEGYKPGVISEIQYLWDPGLDYPTQSMWGLKDGKSGEFILFNLRMAKPRETFLRMQATF